MFLVVAGYHYGELDWGRRIIDEYKSNNLCLDIIFHEIKNSTVYGVERDIGSESEIVEIIKDSDGVDLIIDIHSNHEKFYHIPLLHFDSPNSDVVNDVLLLDNKIKENGFPEVFYHGKKNRLQTGNDNIDLIPYAILETNLLQDYKKALEKTLFVMHGLIKIHRKHYRKNGKV